MDLRQFVADNFTGDLEYHPRRAFVYLALCAACFVSCWFIPGEPYPLTRLVFAAGGIPLLIKGIFFLRKSSEGIGLSYQENEALSANPKPLPSLPALIAQALQDFGAGPMFVYFPIAAAFDLEARYGIDVSALKMFAIGSVIFLLGWIIRRTTTPAQP